MDFYLTRPMSRPSNSMSIIRASSIDELFSSSIHTTCMETLRTAHQFVVSLLCALYAHLLSPCFSCVQFVHTFDVSLCAAKSMLRNTHHTECRAQCALRAIHAFDVSPARAARYSRLL